jgi:hypothetical protein
MTIYHFRIVALFVDLDTVKNIKIYNISNNIAYFNFSKPDGYFEYLNVLCIQNNIVFYNGILFNNVTEGNCLNIKDGDYFSIKIFTVKDKFEDVYVEKEMSI